MAADSDFDRRLESFDNRLRMQERIVTELFESVRTLNSSVQSLERSNEKRVAVDDALKEYINELRVEQKEQKADHRADRNTGISKWNLILAGGLGLFLVGNFVLNILALK